MSYVVGRSMTAAGVMALACLGAIGSAALEAQEAEEPAFERVEGVLPYPEGFAPGRILVADNAGPAPAGCNLMTSVHRVQDLFHAIESDEGRIVSRFFPVEDPEQFGWYSMNGPGDQHYVARDLSTLSDHLRERRLQGERLELRGIQVNRWTNGLAHFGPLYAARIAGDLSEGEHLVAGKGSVDCKTGKFVVLSLVTDPAQLGNVGRLDDQGRL